MRPLTIVAACTVLAPPLRADDTRLVSTLDGSAALGGVISDLSADGRYVLFSSDSSAYVANDTNGRYDLFLRDLQLGTVERVNVASDGSEDPFGIASEPMAGSLSADGQLVAFVTEGALDPADNSDYDVYLRDRAAGTTTLVSHSSAVMGFSRNSFGARITRDGRFVVFSSGVPNLVWDDTNKLPDVFEWERATGIITRVSVDSTGKELRGVSCADPRVSGDGSVVAFQEWLIRGDVVNPLGFFVKDLRDGTLVSLGAGGTVVAISADGRFLLFNTGALYDPDDLNQRYDGYLRDRQLGTNERVTLGTGFSELAAGARAKGMSDDMRRIEFTTVQDATGDGGSGIDDVFVFNRDTGVALRVSLGPSDERSRLACIGGAISGDGRVAMFSGESSSLWPGDTNGISDVFVREFSDIPASFTNYGTGLDGRFGTPSLTLDEVPRRATTVGLDVGNSSGLYTVSVLFVGLASASLPTSLGGTLLVDPFTTLPVPLTPWENKLPFTIPTSGDLPGVHLYLQALELDPWAVKGVSFTAGLDVTIGD